MSLAEHPVFASLTPVFLLIGVGYVAGRRRWVRPEGVRDLSSLAFMVLMPALLFRTMSQVHVTELDARPVLAYFSAAVVVLCACMAWRGFNRHSVVAALASTFSNMVMIGIALVGLAYGQAGLVTLVTLVSVHALILLTIGAVVLELAVAREARGSGQHAPHLVAAAASAIRGALIHPVPLPIAAGLVFSLTGWRLPAVIDRPLQLLGSAYGSLALVLVGASLAAAPMRGHWREAVQAVAVKNLLLPVVVGASAWLWGIRGLPLTVLVVAAGLPTGANVFMFAQRYRVAEELTTATMGASTAAAALTLALVMAAMAWLNPLPGLTG
jgi:malonate transporter